MTFGATRTGFVRKKFEDVLASISTRQKEKISKFLDTTSEKSVVGNLNNIVADEIASAWEALEAAYNGFDPENATGYLMTALASLTGVIQLGPRSGLALCSINVDGGKTFAPGTMVAAVSGQPTNLWSNVNTFTTAPGPTATYTAIAFASVAPGKTAVAPAGTLTVISSPLTGWNSITNPYDATAGFDAETVEALRVRRDESLAIQGSASLKAIVADVAKVTGVVAVRGDENVENVAIGGIPAHGIRLTVYTPPVNGFDLAVAQAIYDSKAGGIKTTGAIVQNVVDPNGVNFPITFDRAVAVAVTVDVTVASTKGFSLTDAKAAVFAVQPTTIAGAVVVSKIAAAVNKIAGIDDVLVVTLTIAGVPQTTNYATPTQSIARFSLLTITVHV